MRAFFLYLCLCSPLQVYILHTSPVGNSLLMGFVFLWMCIIFAIAEKVKAASTKIFARDFIEAALFLCSSHFQHPSSSHE